MPWMVTGEERKKAKRKNAKTQKAMGQDVTVTAFTTCSGHVQQQGQ